MPSMLAADHAVLVQTALPVCAKYGLALAGGYAIRAHGLVARPSDDVDFATGDVAPVAEMVQALAHAYQQAGFSVTVRQGDARKGHLDVTLPNGSAYRVDVLKEALNYPPAMMSVGPVLALRDAVALKLGALHDRGLPRDAIDIHAAAQHFSDGELIALGRRALDEEFSLDTLRQQLDRVLMYGDDEFELYGCTAEHISDIRSWAEAWSERLGLTIVQDEQWSDEDDLDG